MPTVRRNRINDNGYEAIWVAEEGGGVFEDNDLRGNKRGPWDVAATAKDQVKQARNTEE
jgi:parallel beta-helix repeat protein